VETKKIIRKHSGGTFNISYHVVFCPKRRRPVLVDDIARDCKNIIVEILEKIKGKTEALEIMPDHVHLFVSIHPKISPHMIIKKIKGATSNYLRKKYPQLSCLPALWSSSYYVGTVGTVSESTVKFYIENQKGK
jgi:putative transposase